MSDDINIRRRNVYSTKANFGYWDPNLDVELGFVKKDSISRASHA
jgi:hypothetical protein